MSGRLPAIPPAQYDSEQRKAADAFRSLRGAEVFGPFEALMYSPRLMTLAQSVGEYLRYHSVIGTTLSELVILITARNWTQDYEWHVHAPAAEQAGIAPSIVAAIGEGRRPAAMSADETLVYDFSTELQRNKSVCDATWAPAEQRFGKPGVVDMVGISGYYTFLAMQLNAARYPLPPDATKLPRLPE